MEDLPLGKTYRSFFRFVTCLLSIDRVDQSYTGHPGRENAVRRRFSFLIVTLSYHCVNVNWTAEYHKLDKYRLTPTAALLGRCL